jgi:rsbT co-antagonist protein RsbR
MYKNLQDNWVLEQQFVVAERQRQELVALSSPLVEVWNGIIVLPIIGQVGEERAQRMTEKLLAMVAARNIRAVILDMTGVASIDSASIEYLGRMHHAVRLLGSNCVFTGISSTTATLITKMGVDLESWTTFATVRHALGRLSRKKGLA